MNNIVRVIILTMVICACSGCAATTPFGVHPDYIEEMESAANANVFVHPDTHLKLQSNEFDFWLLTTSHKVNGYGTWKYTPWHGGQVDYNSQVSPYEIGKRSVLGMFKKLSDKIGRKKAIAQFQNFKACMNSEGKLIYPIDAIYISMTMAIAHHEQLTIEELIQKLEKEI